MTIDEASEALKASIVASADAEAAFEASATDMATARDKHNAANGALTAAHAAQQKAQADFATAVKAGMT